MSNLPPGVTPSMIPGNRPEDEYWTRVYEGVFEDLPAEFDALLENMQTINRSMDLSEIETACYNIVNLLNPEGEAAGKAKEISDAFEEAGRTAGEWENPPEPEWEPEMDYDY